MSVTKTAADFLTLSTDWGRIYAPEWRAASVKLCDLADATVIASVASSFPRTG